ncbi:uncharacterized protein LOC142632823 [Castanea sativa]|uniref:uncharacterized protein LOC142632823 n=1 Tax=Castanea sativa TaxID=21020 RepID=UPI003F6522A5
MPHLSDLRDSPEHREGTRRFLPEPDDYIPKLDWPSGGGIIAVSPHQVTRDKQLVRPRLSHCNVADLNRVLRSEVFVSEDLQVRAAHLILGYDLISSDFQEIENAIIAGDRRRRRIHVARPHFLADHDIPDAPHTVLYYRPIAAIPLATHSQAMVIPEEQVSSANTLDEEIDRFQLEDAPRPRGSPDG